MRVRTTSSGHESAEPIPPVIIPAAIRSRSDGSRGAPLAPALPLRSATHVRTLFREGGEGSGEVRGVERRGERRA